jgi:PilZ domain
MKAGSLAVGIEALEADADFYAKSGPLPTAFDEVRRFPRFYYRARVRAVIHPLSNKQQTPVTCTLLARDLSRGGINLVHDQQLFPGQKIDVVLTNGTQRSVVVMWCRRISHGCYSLGCRFTKSAENPDDSSVHDENLAAT